MTAPDFAQLVWARDRMQAGGYVFRLQQAAGADWDLGDECFVLYKGQALAEQYAQFFAGCPIDVHTLVELGMWEGGSIAFWNLLLEPETHVGVDLAVREETPYFRRFVESRAESTISTHWGVDQADAAALRRILAERCPDPLDLLIDDASHLYAPTRASFETLFPRLRPGGLYIVEDWAWVHWKAYQRRDHPMAGDPGLSRFVTELDELVGSAHDVAPRLWLHQGFAVVERGPAPLDDGFRIDDHIVRRPRPQSRLEHGIRRQAKAVRRRMRF